MLTVTAQEYRDAALTKRIILIDGHQVFFECSGAELPELKLLDYAVLACICYAMKKGQDLHIDGAVSRTLLRNMEEFQDAWVSWLRGYQSIAITASIEMDDSLQQNRRAVFAFSGGVDSTFVLLRDLNKETGRRACEPIAACLVQGFDIGLSENDAFAVAKTSAKETLDSIGIPLVTVRTNLKEKLYGDDWRYVFGAALAACVHQFTEFANFGVVGADEDYAHLYFPWGSNFITNQFLSGGSFTFVTEGGGFTRTERVKAISKHPQIAKRLRVCWQGNGTNCGRCEKCTRTKLNFMAVRQEPYCFEDGPPTNLQILSIQARFGPAFGFLCEIYQSAKRNEIKESWVFWVGLAIFKNFLLLSIRDLLRSLRTRSG